MTVKEFNQIYSDFIENARGEIVLKAVNKKTKQWEAPWESECKRFFIYNKTVCCLYMYNEDMFLYAGKTYKIISLEHLLTVLDMVGGEKPLVFILTGPDNVGKSTICKTLSELFLCDTVHLNAIYGSTHEETWCNHQKLYNDIVSSQPKPVIYDRFIEDEYVYGPRYREGNVEEIKKFISRIETEMLTKYNIIFVSLTADQEFLIKNDDGRSLSGNHKDNLIYEIEAFKDTYNNALFTNKKLVKVNEKDHYRDISDIIKEILS